MPGCGTTNPLFILRLGKYLAVEKFYFGFANLKKAFDQLPRDVV